MYRLLSDPIESGIKHRRTARPRVRVLATRPEHVWPFAVEDNGIGLAACQRLARHGGRIRVGSQEGTGSVFHFALPAACAAGCLAELPPCRP